MLEWYGGLLRRRRRTAAQCDIKLELERRHHCVQWLRNYIGGGDGDGIDEFAIAIAATTSILISLMTSAGHMVLGER